MLLVTESAPSNRRGFYGAYAQAGAPVGVILANIAFISVSSLTTEEDFLSVVKTMRLKNKNMFAQGFLS